MKDIHFKNSDCSVYFCINVIDIQQNGVEDFLQFVIIKKIRIFIREIYFLLDFFTVPAQPFTWRLLILFTLHAVMGSLLRFSLSFLHFFISKLHCLVRLLKLLQKMLKKEAVLKSRQDL